MSVKLLPIVWFPSSYGSGTHPWNRSSGADQRTDDGKIEVLGLTTYQMVRCQEEYEYTTHFLLT